MSFYPHTYISILMYAWVCLLIQTERQISQKQALRPIFHKVHCSQDANMASFVESFHFLSSAVIVAWPVVEESHVRNPLRALNFVEENFAVFHYLIY